MRQVKFLIRFSVMSLLFLLFIPFTGCEDNNKPTNGSGVDTSSHSAADTARTSPMEKVYSNERFRNVTVKALSGQDYEISGQAQLFEAVYSWVIEDGHNELQEGHGMTDAGAPEWGKFSFKVTVDKPDPNIATLHLILFESSPKDGSRQYELPVPLD